MAGCGDRSVLTPEQIEAEIESLIAQASNHVLIFSYERAVPVYLRVRELATPGTHYWALGTFGAATAFWHSLPPNRSNMQQATTLFTELTEVLTAESDFWARAHLNLGRIAEMENFPGDRSDPARALEHYQTVLAALPGHIYADEAAGRIAGNSLFDFADEEGIQQAFQDLEAHLAGTQNTEVLAALWHFLGENYWHFLKDAPRSIHAMQQAAATGSIRPTRLEVLYWRIAWLSEHHLNNLPQAIYYYHYIAENLPRSIRSYEARIAYQRLLEQDPSLREFITGQ